MTRIFHPNTELRVTANNIQTIIKEDSTGKNLDMAFEIELFAGTGKKSNPNTAKISVWNLKESNRLLFSEEHQAVEFRAGYGDNLGLIFSGQTTNVLHEFEAPNWRTDIYAGDGIKEWETAYFNKSYSAGTGIDKILTDMCVATGLPYVIDTFIPDDLLYGESYSGLVKDTLNTVCAARNLEWSIQFGTIEITQRDSPLVKDPISTLLRQDTGMIGSPQVVERTVKKKKKNKKEKRVFGIRVVSALNPDLKPKRLVTIEARRTTSAVGKLFKESTPQRKNVDGTYVIKSVRFVGNNHGGDFQSILEADLQ